MRNARIHAAEMVAQNLEPAEASIEIALASVATLTKAMLDARAEAKLSHCVAQDAFDHLGEATALLFKVRSKIVDAHRSLHVAQRDIGLRELSFGTSQGSLDGAESASDQSNVVALAA